MTAPDITPDGLTRRDREALAKLARQRAALAKAEAKERTAQLRADGEAQLATIFRADDARWATAVAVAEAAVADANATINRHCEAAGIPENFRPSIGMGWMSRKENATASRRVELRRVLDTRVAALEKQAITEIDRRALDVQTALLAGGLDSAEARAYLEAMPTADALMPGLAVRDFPEVAALTHGLAIPEKETERAA